MSDWLGNDDLTPPTDWLEAPAEARIEGGAKLRGEKNRFKSMVKSLVGKSRTWATDGEYVAFRRKQANPATLQRHENFIKLGNYKHVSTQGDVEIYELQEGSAFKRTPVNLMKLDVPTIRRQAVLAGVARDWPLFVDILAELATRIKNTVAQDGKKIDARLSGPLYDENLAYVFEWIWKRGGPLQPEIDAGVQAVRAARGESSGRIITAPPAIVTPGQMRPGARRLLQRNRIH